MWTPTPERAAQTDMARVIGLAGKKSYDELHAWSVAERGAFWNLVWEFCGVKGQKGARTLVDGDRMPGALWFPDARLNFAENLLGSRDHRDAIVFWGEDRVKRRLSHRNLYDLVSRLSQALADAGVKKGDRVAGYLPNLPEATAAMLATASLGAVWSSCSPDFGVQGVLDRFGQIQPRVLFCADGYRYAGKEIASERTVAGIVDRIPSIERVVIVPYLHDRVDDAVGARTTTYAEFRAVAPTHTTLDFERFPFDHPLYVMYSSGTTGLPKCMVHGAGGTLLQHQKEHVLHCDIGRDDRVFYFTTCGWMMWNWLVSALATGASIVLYDGAPLLRRKPILWDMAQAERITVFGTSAKWLALAEKEGLRPRETHDLTSLESILSTGSPLATHSFDYVYEHVKPNVRLSSISGGTDLISCFALGNPIGPVWRGEIQTRGLGMQVEIFDDDGNAIVERAGELVCTAPFPSMPIYFWDDPRGEKYRSAYF